MDVKKFFKFTWTTFLLLVIFNVLGNFVRIPSAFGKSVGAGIFDIFSFFSQFNCATPKIGCSVWDPFLAIAIIVLNLFWQLFLANLVLLIYYKIKK